MSNSHVKDIVMPDDQGQTWQLSQQESAYIVMYFYPKAMTPGCTVQSCQYRDASADLASLQATVVGVSKDPVDKLAKFKQKENLNFTLLSDHDTNYCEDFGVWVKKSMYGKSYMGIERSTFLLNPRGDILKAWPKVAYKEDVAIVRSYLEDLAR